MNRIDDRNKDGVGGICWITHCLFPKGAVSDRFFVVTKARTKYRHGYVDQAVQSVPHVQFCMLELRYWSKASTMGFHVLNSGRHYWGWWSDSRRPVPAQQAQGADAMPDAFKTLRNRSTNNLIESKYSRLFLYRSWQKDGRTWCLDSDRISKQPSAFHIRSCDISSSPESAIKRNKF